MAEGKRITDEALTEYERTGATAEIAELIGEYGRSLEQIGDYKGALALYHRERKLNDELAIQTRQRALLEVQEKYEADQRDAQVPCGDDARVHGGAQRTPAPIDVGDGGVRYSGTLTRGDTSAQVVLDFFRVGPVVVQVTALDSGGRLGGLPDVERAMAGRIQASS